MELLRTHEPLKAFVFDMDGTLLDSLPDLVDVTNETLTHFGYPTHTTEEILAMIGNGLRSLILQALPQDLSDDATEAALAWWKTRYDEVGNRKTTVYDGMLDTLAELKARGMKLAVLSNKYDGGVQMEAESIEDGGQAIRFNVFVYNVEPGVEIDYVTGKSWESSDVPSMTTGGEATTTRAGATPNANVEEASSASTKGSDENAHSENETQKNNVESDQTNRANNAAGSSGAKNSGNGASSEEGSATSHELQEYVLNTKSMKFHRPTCSSVDDIADNNKQEATDTRDKLISEGYSPCKQCNP